MSFWAVVALVLGVFVVVLIALLVALGGLLGEIGGALMHWERPKRKRGWWRRGA